MKLHLMLSLISDIQGCGAEVFLDIFYQDPICGFLFLLYIFLTMFTVLNMLIGVLCEVGKTAAQHSWRTFL